MSHIMLLLGVLGVGFLCETCHIWNVVDKLSVPLRPRARQRFALLCAGGTVTATIGISFIMAVIGVPYIVAFCVVFEVYMLCKSVPYVLLKSADSRDGWKIFRKTWEHHIQNYRDFGYDVSIIMNELRQDQWFRGEDNNSGSGSDVGGDVFETVCEQKPLPKPKLVRQVAGIHYSSNGETLKVGEETNTLDTTALLDKYETEEEKRERARATGFGAVNVFPWSGTHTNLMLSRTEDENSELDSDDENSGLDSVDPAINGLRVRSRRSGMQRQLTVVTNDI